MNPRLLGLSLVLALPLAATPLMAGTPEHVRAPEQAPGAATGRKPNIILLLTDDQDYLLNSLDYMPNLKFLIADQGITFANDFVPLSLCCPGRTTILRGQYPHNHQILTNSLPGGGFEKAYAESLETATLATALHDAGYKTCLLGKYLNGYPDTAPSEYIPPGWDYWYSPDGGNPYAEYNYSLNENGTSVSYGSTPSDYLTDVILARALSFINQAAQTPNQPIFMYFATYAPHQPATPAPRHANLFPNAEAPRRPSFNEADVTDKPEYIQAMPLLTSDDVQAIDTLYQNRLRSLQAVDEAYAAIIQALQATGRLDDTYIFFTADNGFHMGEHRLQPGKYTPYETDIRVPLIVSGPGVPRGVTLPHFTSEVDLAATFADLAGTTLGVPADGRSLVPLLKAGPPAATAWRQAELLEQSQNGNPLNDRSYARAWKSGKAKGYLEPPDPQDVRTEAIPWPGHIGYETWNYKFVEYDTGFKELFVLTSDRDDLYNQAANVSPAILTALDAYANTLTACAGPGCSQADGVAPPPLLTAGFTTSPATPTDLTPVTFTASANGTSPYTFVWNLGGTMATGSTVTKTFSPPGAVTVTLDVQDGITAQRSVTKTLTIAPSIVVSGIGKGSSSGFSLTVNGSNFEQGCQVQINGAAAPGVTYKSATKIVVTGGSALKAMLPKGTTVQIVCLNPDGGQSLPIPFTR